MKRNIYSKLWMIFFVLMGTACTNQVEDAIPVSDQPIEFSVQSDWKEIPNTRSNDGKTYFKDSDSIQIFGFHNSSSPGGQKDQKFMYRVNDRNRGQIVEYKEKDKNWIYSPKRFWPKEGTLDFYAGYPHYSVLNDEENHKMTYEQTVNPLQLDLLWGVSNNHDCVKDRNKNVEITMKHALAKVNIKFDSSLGDIKQAKVSAYKAGNFDRTNTNGIPDWIVDTTSIQEATFSPYKEQTKIGDVTVFILPDKITGLILTKVDGKTKIDVSAKIQKYTFEAGKVYNLTIKSTDASADGKIKGRNQYFQSDGEQNNTNTRSIAMSVRCVSK